MFLETKTHKLRVYPAAIILSSLFCSIVTPVNATEAPRKQTFVVTAYYSPLPDQCCYARGGYEEDIVFNGKGTHGADGTPVYPGMIAAPPTYAFGTVIELPSIGVVGVVNDRGGRIIEWNNDIHRIDLWMGHGEEGLARALLWGSRTVEGVVYPASQGPATRFVLNDFDADVSMIANLSVPPQSDLLPKTEEGYTTNGVRRLQQDLYTLGYFTAKPNAHFGPATKDALNRFLLDYRVIGDGSELSEEASATIAAALTISTENLPTLAEGMELGLVGDDVRQAQKLLRYLEYYKGRTNGEFDTDLRRAVLSFQVDHGVVTSDGVSGAGRIGPATRTAIVQAWKVKVVKTKANAMLMKERVRVATLQAALPSTNLSKGDRGEEVKKLQRLLIDTGYLSPTDLTGTFGPRTEQALKKYQLDQQIIASASMKGAGIFGPSTRRFAAEHVADVAWQRVRSGM
jgi:peptidoglycan hydrolase-like protein with peptidoglycan-binding domain